MITETRQILYYNKYQFRAKIINSDLSSTRNISTIEEFIKRKQHYATYGIGTARPRVLAPTELDSVGRYLAWIHKNSGDITVRTQGNGVSVFSNDLELLKDLSTIYSNTEFSKVDLLSTPASGVKYFAKEPKYQYRVMIKNIKIKTETLSDLQSLLARYDCTVMRPSKSFAKWISRVNKWSLSTQFYIYGSFFIDYNDPSMLTIMHLSASGIFGKSYKLEKRPAQ